MILVLLPLQVQSVAITPDELRSGITRIILFQGILVQLAQARFLNSCAGRLAPDGHKLAGHQEGEDRSDV